MSGWRRVDFESNKDLPAPFRGRTTTEFSYKALFMPSRNDDLHAKPSPCRMKRARRKRIRRETA